MKTIRVEEGTVFRVTLAVPERRNAIGGQMIDELLAAHERATKEGARAIVLSGEGKFFSAGGDFSSGEGRSLGDFASLLRCFMRSTVPIVARVNGLAMGGGLGLVAASTFAVASKSAHFATPEVNLGLFPMMIMAVLGRVVPRRRLLEMMVFGERFDAERAEELGIVNAAVVDEELDSAVEAYVSKILSKSPVTLQHGLTAYADQCDVALDEALPMLRERLGKLLSTEDAAEGISAFIEKRQPVWKGR